MTEAEIRGIVRQEIEEMLLDDTLGLHIRTVVVNALKQCGIEEMMLIRAGQSRTH
jgi:hypothetical protein